MAYCCAPVKSGRWWRSAVPLVVVYQRAGVRAVVAVLLALLLACCYLLAVVVAGGLAGGRTGAVESTIYC